MEFIVCSILCINAFFNWNDDWNLGEFVNQGMLSYEKSINSFQPYLDESKNITVVIRKTENDDIGCSKALITVRNIFMKETTPEYLQSDYLKNDKYFESKSLGVIVCKTKSV